MAYVTKWNIITGEKSMKFEGHTGNITSMSLSECN